MTAVPVSAQDWTVADARVLKVTGLPDCGRHRMGWENSVCGPAFRARWEAVVRAAEAAMARAPSSTAQVAPAGLDLRTRLQNCRSTDARCFTAALEAGRVAWERRFTADDPEMPKPADPAPAAAADPACVEALARSYPLTVAEVMCGDAEITGLRAAFGDAWMAAEAAAREGGKIPQLNVLLDRYRSTGPVLLPIAPCGADPTCIARTLQGEVARLRDFALAAVRPPPAPVPLPPVRDAATLAASEPHRPRTTPPGIAPDPVAFMAAERADSRAVPLRSDELAAEEARFRNAALERGVIYRAPDFWANFRHAAFLRQVFDGNGAYGKPGTFFPWGRIEAGTSLLGKAVLGWAAAYDRLCGRHLADPAATYTVKSFEIDRRTGAETPTGTTAIRIHANFVDGMRAWYVEKNTPAAKLREIGRGLEWTRQLMAARNPFEAALGIAGRELGPGIDMARFIGIAGCDTPTALQFLSNLSRIAAGQPTLQSAGIPVEGAETASDPAPALGQLNSVGEACWAVGGWGFEVPAFCRCLDAEAAARLPRAPAPPVDYRALYREANRTTRACNALRR